MGEPSLRELEHDVEVARSKLGRNLAILRSPETYSQFSTALQGEALSIKDTVVRKARSSLQSSFESFVEDLKAKAAANPTAALAIGAGIAWRLIQRPPVASALVGAGLYSLMNTKANGVHGRSDSDYLGEATTRLGDQARDVATNVQEQAGRALDAVTSRVVEIAGDTKQRVEDMLHTGASQVADGAATTKDRMAELASQATAAAREASTQIRQEVGSHVSSVTNAAERVTTDRESRDALLLGVAGLAVVAALGISCQRKLKENQVA